MQRVLVGVYGYIPKACCGMEPFTTQRKRRSPHIRCQFFSTLYPQGMISAGSPMPGEKRHAHTRTLPKQCKGQAREDDEKTRKRQGISYLWLSSLRVGRVQYGLRVLHRDTRHVILGFYLTPVERPHPDGDLNLGHTKFTRTAIFGKYFPPSLSLSLPYPSIRQDKTKTRGRVPSRKVLSDRSPLHSHPVFFSPSMVPVTVPSLPLPLHHRYGIWKCPPGSPLRPTTFTNLS
jgi:hypothetical protein